MNEHEESIPVPPPISPESILTSSMSLKPRPLSHWLRRFLACNPFYLVSAALLLFGVYRVSMDTAFLTKETTQLAFNFSSLQLYELLLVGTAIFLARRAIWYDSTLLVSLENLLLLVPFILISQAALIDKETVGWVSALAGVLVIIRYGSLKRFIAELNLPNRLLAGGVTVLVVNVTLLAIYRVLQETRTEVWGRAHQMNEFSWLLVLPAVFALGNFLPKAKEVGALPPQHRWLPIGFFALWLTGTAVHLYCLSYVYGFPVRRELLVPTFWVIAWTASRRLSDFTTVPKPCLVRALLVIPMIAALFAAQGNNRVFLALTLLNAAIYGAYCLLKKDQRFVQHLLFGSVVMFVAGLPMEAMRWTGPHFSRGNYLMAGVAIYVVLCTWLSRNPQLGVVGALLSAASVMTLLGHQPMATHWALQAGFVFLLLHSFRWDDAAHQGAAKMRLAAAAVWVLHSIVWTRFGGDWWMVCVPAAVVVAAGLTARIFRGRWEHLILLASAVLVMLSGPGNLLVGVLQAAPSGLLAIAGSFLLLAVGTAAALTKHRWHHKPVMQRL